MTKSLRVAGLLIALAVLGGSTMAQEGGRFRRIVTFSANVPSSERVAIVKRQGGIVVHELPLINAVAAEFPQAAFMALDASLGTTPGIVKAENDAKRKWVESAPIFPEVEVSALSETLEAYKSSRATPLRKIQALEVRAEGESNIPWGVARVKAPAAWSTTMGDGIKVGVIDTGIDYNHPQLKANIRGGWNALQGADSNNFMDDHGHGTHVSGTIAAVDNGQGVAGVAPHAVLYGIKVLDASGFGSDSDVIAGINWAVEHKLDVVNMSLGSDQGSDALQAAVEAASKAGLTIIAAAGNSGPGANTVGYPGAYPQVIAIAAMDSKDKIASFSSRGPQVGFVAPGVNVYSTFKNGGYTTMSGTSMACPHMVGLAALVMSIKHIRGANAVRAAFQAAATSLSGPSTDEQGAGVVDAVRLVR